jgi:hypothetical protein
MVLRRLCVIMVLIRPISHGLGHRTTTCQHSDRELFEVLSRGRPISQCVFCQLERHVKGRHVRCQCLEGSLLSSPDGPSQRRKSGPWAPARPRKRKSPLLPAVQTTFSPHIPPSTPAKISQNRGVESEYRVATVGDGCRNQKACCCLTGSSCQCCQVKSEYGK